MGTFGVFLKNENTIMKQLDERRSKNDKRSGQDPNLQEQQIMLSLKALANQVPGPDASAGKVWPTKFRVKFNHHEQPTYE
jgi:hypothetical protein